MLGGVTLGVEVLVTTESALPPSESRTELGVLIPILVVCFDALVLSLLDEFCSDVRDCEFVLMGAFGSFAVSKLPLQGGFLSPRNLRTGCFAVGFHFFALCSP